MRKVWKKLLISMFIFVVCMFVCHVPAQALTKGQNNIVKRAYQQVNMKWTPKKTINAYKDSSGKLTGVFYKGVTYSGVPYGQQVDSGKYLPFEASFGTFLAAVKDENSLFYTARGKYGRRNSTYYANDCSAFVSYCYNLPRMITSSIAKSDRFIKVTGNNLYYAQVGDCLNKSGSHVVLITKMVYDASGNLTKIEICEQTPPLARKKEYTPIELQKVIKNKGYTILRYKNRDLVPAPFSSEETTEELVKVSKITLGAISTRIAPGKKVQLVSSIVPSDASEKSLTWSSSNSDVVSVNQSGVITTKKSAKGKFAIITAKAKDGSGKKATIRINVMKGAVQKIVISGNKTVKAGKKVTLKTYIKAPAGSNTSLYWWSSKTKYATVSNGVVKTKSAGKGKTVTITAKASDGSNKTATFKIKIK